MSKNINLYFFTFSYSLQTRLSHYIDPVETAKFGSSIFIYFLSFMRVFWGNSFVWSKLAESSETGEFIHMICLN